eukprot:GHVR01140355.1.p1 GENE.GHVR01140355.1~~GHVR01140355.1.p1  ORF type:complete len:149 (-),score=61.31 GHVR01140355.1:43-489(-)
MICFVLDCPHRLTHTRKHTNSGSEDVSSHTEGISNHSDDDTITHTHTQTHSHTQTHTRTQRETHMDSNTHGSNIAEVIQRDIARVISVLCDTHTQVQTRNEIGGFVKVWAGGHSIEEKEIAMCTCTFHPLILPELSFMTKACVCVCYI